MKMVTSAAAATASPSSPYWSLLPQAAGLATPVAQPQENSQKRFAFQASLCTSPDGSPAAHVPSHARKLERRFTFQAAPGAPLNESPAAPVAPQPLENSQKPFTFRAAHSTSHAGSVAPVAPQPLESTRKLSTFHASRNTAPDTWFLPEVVCILVPDSLPQAMTRKRSWRGENEEEYVASGGGGGGGSGRLCDWLQDSSCFSVSIGTPRRTRQRRRKEQQLLKERREQQQLQKDQQLQHFQQQQQKQQYQQYQQQQQQQLQQSRIRGGIPLSCRPHTPPSAGNQTQPSFYAGNQTQSSCYAGNQTQRQQQQQRYGARGGIPLPCRPHTPPCNQRRAPPLAGNQTQTPPSAGNQTQSPPPAGNQTMSPPPAGNQKLFSPPAGNQTMSTPPAGNQTLLDQLRELEALSYKDLNRRHWNSRELRHQNLPIPNCHKLQQPEALSCQNLNRRDWNRRELTHQNLPISSAHDANGETGSPRAGRAAAAAASAPPSVMVGYVWKDELRHPNLQLPNCGDANGATDSFGADRATALFGVGGPTDSFGVGRAAAACLSVGAPELLGRQAGGPSAASPAGFRDVSDGTCNSREESGLRRQNLEIPSCHSLDLDQITHTLPMCPSGSLPMSPSGTMGRFISAVETCHNGDSTTRSMGEISPLEGGSVQAVSKKRRLECRQCC